jgi:hypothetical protein
MNPADIKWVKPVCRIDQDNIFSGVEEAYLDVMAKDGSYLIPASCIDTAPPQVKDGQAARWNGEGWDVIEDHRGKVAYRKTDGSAVTIDQLGSISDDLTMTAPPSEYSEWDGKKWVENQAKKAQAAADFLEASKRALLKAIARNAQNIVAAKSGMDTLPPFEVQTWPLQAAEAAAWKADPSAPTPILDQIATARGIDKDTIKAAAFDKAVAYEKLSATVAGLRQAIETNIVSAKTIEELNAVNTEINI